MNNRARAWDIVIIILTILGLAIVMNQVFFFRAFGFAPTTEAFLYWVLGAFLPLVFIVFPFRKKSKGVVNPEWHDVLLAGASLVIIIYYAFNSNNIIYGGWDYVAPTLPTLLAFILWALVLEALRRAAGLPIFILTTFFSMYPLFAGKVPISFLSGISVSFEVLARSHAMSPNSILGLPMQTAATILAGFLLFGVTLEATGGANFFFNLAQALFGTARGGPAKVAVVGSAFMGMMSGSAVSNVVTTGTITIPAMKRTGFTPEFAGGVEAIASTGGSITPPIMGSAAFIMASFLAMPYSEIALAAAIPAVLYYMSIFLQIDAHAAKTNLRGFARSELPLVKDTLLGGWPFIFAIAFLVYLLTIMKNEAQAPFAASAVTLLIAAIRKKDRLNIQTLKKIFLDVGKTNAEIFGIIAGVGLVVGGLSISGVSLSFSGELVRLAGGSSIFILIAGAFTSFILGMGMTVSAVYVFLAIVMAPALIQQGFNPIASHLFVIYWATVSYVTPPVALASYAAAGIAKGNAVKTSFISMRLGVVAFIIPFMYIYNPALVGQGSIGEIVLTFITASIGVLLLSAAFEGWFLGIGCIAKITRTILVPAGLLLMTPGIQTDLIGFALGGIAVIPSLLVNKKNKKDSPVSANQ